jgi:hypothetical protein
LNAAIKIAATQNTKSNHAEIGIATVVTIIRK